MKSGWARLLWRLALVVPAAALWIQSHFGGWEWRSNDPIEQRGSILASRPGVVFYYSCTIDPANWRDLGMPDAKFEMPANFAIGTPNGEAWTLECGPRQVIAYTPAATNAYKFFWNSEIDNNQNTKTRWSASVSETMFSYWFLTLVLSLPLVVEIWRRVKAALFGPREGS